jgi:hypothetical protein
LGCQKRRTDKNDSGGKAASNLNFMECAPRHGAMLPSHLVWLSAHQHDLDEDSLDEARQAAHISSLD